MGNRSSEAAKQFSHPKLGHCTILDNLTPPLLEHLHPIKNAQEGDTFKAEIDHMKTFDQTHLFLAESVVLQGKGMCGSSGFARSQYPFYQFNLENEITQRRTNNEDFKEREMLYLIYVVARVGRQLERGNARIGDVRPENVLMNEGGHIKLFCLASAPQEKSGFDKAFQNKEVAYLAPEELMELSKNNAYPTDLNNTKAECFSTGVLVLELGTNHDVKQLYNMNTYKLDQDLLEKLKQQFQKKHSPILSYIVMKMLELQADNRPYFSELAALLEPYAVDIESHRDVQINPELCMESLRKHEATPNSLFSRTFSRMTEDILLEKTKWVTSTVVEVRPQLNQQSPPTGNTRPGLAIGIIPRPNPINLMSALQEVIPPGNFTQSVYKPAQQPITTTTVIRDSKIPQIRFNYQSPPQ